MGSLLNFVFLNDKLIGNGDGLYGQTGPVFNYLFRWGIYDNLQHHDLNNFSYTTNGELREGYKNIFLIETIEAGYGIEKIPDEVFNFLNNNDIKIILAGVADPTSIEAYNLTMERLKDKINFNKIIWVDSNAQLENIEQLVRTYTFDYFLEEATQTIDRAFEPHPNDLGYISEEIDVSELNTFRNKKFLCFNRNSEKVHRFALLDAYIQEKFKDSYFSFVVKLDYFKEATAYFDDNIPTRHVNFYNSYLPIELDTHSVQNKESFKTNNTFKKELFLNSCINLVTETSFFSNELFISEKILKPILNYQPFIVFGPHKYLSRLKKYGFKTFSDFWDESYDDIENWRERLNKLMQLVEYLNNKSIEELNDIYKSTMDICIYNRNLFHSLELDSLKVILGEIENEW